MANIVRQGDSEYDAMMAALQSCGGVQVAYGGGMWALIQDNDGPYFVLVSQQSGFERSYGATSVPTARKRTVRKAKK